MTIPESRSALLGEDFLNDIFCVEDEISRQRIIVNAANKARDLGCLQDFRSLVSAYKKQEKSLNRSYKYAENVSNLSFMLETDDKGEIAQTTNNFLDIMRNDEYFVGLKFNLLTYSPERETDGITEKWTDADDAQAREYVERKYKIYNAQKMDDAMRIIFNANKYHPIKQLIESIKWDGRSRISNMLIDCLKCDNTPYTQEVSRLIFAGGIHRIYNSGCKFDDVPVLIGTKQGEGKSTFVRWLAMQDDFFTEVTEIEGQKGMESVEGAWICELGELLALTKAKEVEAVKSYITRLVDRYRRPFDKRVTDHKRQCIFIGTTNREQFLTDKTGNRRFYPVRINQSGYEMFERKEEIQDYIKQCWAEAKHKMDNGELKPYADREILSLIREEQAAAVEDDYREGLIKEYLENKTEVCVLEIWYNALGNDYQKPTKKDSNDIGLIMQGMTEWAKGKTKRTDKYGVQKVWTKLGTISDEEYPF